MTKWEDVCEIRITHFLTHISTCDSISKDVSMPVLTFTCRHQRTCGRGAINKRDVEGLACLYVVWCSTYPICVVSVPFITSLVAVCNPDVNEIQC